MDEVLHLKMNELSKNIITPLKVKSKKADEKKKTYEDKGEDELEDEGEEEEEEQEEEQEDAKYNPKQKTQITFHLPDDTTEIMQENMGTEIGYLKLMLSNKLQKPYDKIQLVYNQKIMIDPLSIIDIVKENLQEINIQVNYID